jgi:hypothetical protein
MSHTMNSPPFAWQGMAEATSRLDTKERYTWFTLVRLIVFPSPFMHHIYIDPACAGLH